MARPTWFNWPWVKPQKADSVPVDADNETVAEAFPNAWANSPDRKAFFDSFTGPADNPSPVLFYEQGKAGAGYNEHPMDLLVECVNKDPYLQGEIRKRAANVVHMDSPIQQADLSLEARASAALIDRAFRTMSGGIKRIETEMLECGIPYGFSVHEIEWEVQEFPLAIEGKPRVKQWAVPRALRQARPRRVGFDSDGYLMLRYSFKDPAQAKQKMFLPSEHEEWWYPHPNNVLIFNRYGDYDSPYGYGLMSTLFYNAWFKRNLKKFWIVFSEQFATPKYTARQRENSPLVGDDLTAMRALMQAIQLKTGILLPASIDEFKLHQLMGNSTSENFKTFIDSLNDEASILISGQTSTAKNERAGSMASSEVHERQALALYASDARVLESSLNGFIRLIVEMNMGQAGQFKLPQITIKTNSEEVSLKALQNLELALKMGLKIPMREAYRRGSIDEPIPGEPLLELQETKAPSQLPQNKSPQRQQQRQNKAAPKQQAQPRRQQ